MNMQNKLVLGLFSLAFISLGGLQAATQYLNYNQSSVLGDQTSYFAQVGGKANFNVCSTNSDCASAYCHPILKRCLPYSASTPVQAPLPTKSNFLPMPTVIQLNPNIPCSAAQDLYDRYCNRMYPTDNSQTTASNYISCDQYQTFLTKSCQLAKPTLILPPTLSPTKAPLPSPTSITSASCRLTKYYLTDLCPTISSEEVMARGAKYTCSNGYEASYNSTECQPQEVIYKSVMSLCSQQICSKNTAF